MFPDGNTRGFSRASLMVRSQADPKPPLGITLVSGHGIMPVWRTAEGLWLPGKESQFLSGSLMQRGLAVPKHPWLLWILTQSFLQ